VARISFAVVAVAVVLDVLLKGSLIGHLLAPTAIYVLLFVNIDFWEWYWLANHRPGPVFIYTAGRLVVRMLVVIAAASLSHNVMVIIWSLIALEGARLTVSAIAWKASITPNEPPAAKNLWREQLRYCLPWGLAMVIGTTTRNLGNIAIVKWLGTVSLAYYTIGLYGEPVITTLRNSISTVLLPEMVKRSGTDAAGRLEIWGRATVYNCIILFPIAVLVFRFAAPLIGVTFGKAYLPAAPVLQVYGLVIVRECFDLTLPLRAANRTTPMIYSTLIGLVVGAICLTLLVPRLGILGGVSALVISSTSEAVFLSILIGRMSGVSAARIVPWRTVFTVAAAAGLAGIVTWSRIWVAVPSFLGVICASVVYAAAFVLLLRLFRVTELQQVWDRVRSMIRRSR
jgi:O-antigen/teichoic acid export membrane protein